MAGERHEPRRTRAGTLEGRHARLEASSMCLDFAVACEQCSPTRLIGARGWRGEAPRSVGSVTTRWRSLSGAARWLEASSMLERSRGWKPNATGRAIAGGHGQPSTGAEIDAASASDACSAVSAKPRWAVPATGTTRRQDDPATSTRHTCTGGTGLADAHSASVAWDPCDGDPRAPCRGRADHPRLPKRDNAPHPNDGHGNAERRALQDRRP